MNIYLDLRQVKLGLLLALLSIFFGFALGAVFGVFEDALKADLKNRGTAVLETKYQNDISKMEKVADKSWSYFKRSHLHGGSIGTSATIMILVISLLPARKIMKQLTAFLLGFGALGYSIYWLVAGIMAPGLGGTDVAKESLRWLGMPTSAACIIGITLVLFYVVKWLFVKRAE